MFQPVDGMGTLIEMVLYHKLNQIVANRHVVMVAPGADLPDLPVLKKSELPPLIVRFNTDGRDCDIWVTTFFRDVDPSKAGSPRLIVSTVPRAKVAYWNPARPHERGSRDFAQEIDTVQGLAPVECVDPDHWRSLALAMPIFPLSGLVMIFMLCTTQLVRCDIHGFDFYTNMSRENFFRKVGYDFRPVDPLFLMHDYAMAVGWLKRFLAADTRFNWRGSTSLDEMETEIQKRIRMLRFRALKSRIMRKFGLVAWLK